MALSPRAFFNRKMIEEISLSCPGVYILWFNKICTYVGEKNRPIRKRLREHWSNCHNDDLKNWIHAQGRKLEFQWECIPAISLFSLRKESPRIWVKKECTNWYGFFMKRLYLLVLRHSYLIPVSTTNNIQ